MSENHHLTVLEFYKIVTVDVILWRYSNLFGTKRLELSIV